MKPLLILVSGPPGVGKSTLAHKLGQTLKAVVLDKDCIDEPFSPNDRGPHYTQHIEPKVLRVLFNLAEINLRVGLSVLLDVPWTHLLLNTPKLRRSIKSLMKTARARLLILECVIGEDLLRDRIKARGLARDQVKLSKVGWARFRKTDRLGAPNPLPHVTLDASLSRRRVLAEALSAIKKASAKSP